MSATMRVFGTQLDYVILLCACAVGFTATSPVLAASRDAARTLLNGMQEAREKIKNVQCTVDRVKWQSQEAQEASYQELVRRGGRYSEAAMHKRPYVLQRYGFAFDDRGRFRTVELQGTCDPNGALLSQDVVMTHTWDGSVSMELFERGAKNGNIGRTAPLRRTLDDYEPGAEFGGVFCRFLERAIADQYEMRVHSEDGRCRVEIVRGKTKVVALVAPLQGYTVSHFELCSGERTLKTWDATFREVLPGIWYPVEATVYLGTPEDARGIAKVKVTALTVNDPNLADTVFRIDFPEDTRVFDPVTGVDYVVGGS